MDKNIKKLYVSKVCKEFNDKVETLSLASFVDFINKYVVSITRVDGRGFRLQDRLDGSGTNAYLSSNKWKRDYFPANYSDDKIETNVERIIFKDVFSEIIFFYKKNIDGNPFFVNDCNYIINSFNIKKFYDMIDFIRVVYYSEDMSKRWDITASNWEFLSSGDIVPISIFMTSRISLNENEKMATRIDGRYIESVYLQEDVRYEIDTNRFSKMIHALLSFYSSIMDRTNKEILLEEEKIENDVITRELEQVGIINVEKTEKT